MKAFVIAMKRSTDPTDPIRKKLLDCDPLETCDSAKKAVEEILEGLPGKLKIPAGVVVRFYFDPKVPGGFSDIKSLMDSGVPENNCQTILSLPANRPNAVPPKHWDDPVLAFGQHLRCCYPPWTPELSAACK